MDLEDLIKQIADEVSDDTSLYEGDPENYRIAYQAAKMAATRISIKIMGMLLDNKQSN